MFCDAQGKWIEEELALLNPGRDQELLRYLTRTLPMSSGEYAASSSAAAVGSPSNTAASSDSASGYDAKSKARTRESRNRVGNRPRAGSVHVKSPFFHRAFLLYIYLFLALTLSFVFFFSPLCFGKSVCCQISCAPLAFLSRAAISHFVNAISGLAERENRLTLCFLWPSLSCTLILWSG